jgi:type IV pilus assembly protein PilA
MQSMKKVQQGFTLIELMIVVAIIGILAAIALPAYMDYTARAQATEALTATAGIRADIAVYLSENGDTAGVDADTAILDTAGALNGNYFSPPAVIGANGSITVTFDDGVHAPNAMTITPTIETSGQISTWVCSGLVDKYLPAACRP